MKLKRILIITLVLLAILTIGAVSASNDTNFNEELTVKNLDGDDFSNSIDDFKDNVENEEDNVVSDVLSDSIQNDRGNNLSLGESYDIQASSNDDVLEDVVDPNSFAQLQYLINITDSYGQLPLSNNFIGDNANWVTIDKPLTIDGRGFTVDANKTSYIFTITTTEHITLKNINFLNGIAAIWCDCGADLTVSNCNFENCSDYHDTLNLPNSVCSFENCNFNNFYSSYGFGLDFQDSSCSFMNCNFNNFYSTYGIGLDFQDSSCSFMNCNFNNCSGYYGALFISNGTSSFVNCNFSECGTYHNGILTLENVEGSFINCIFEKNANLAEYLDIDANGGSYIFEHCRSINTTGIYVSNGKCSVNDCNFTTIQIYDYAPVTLDNVNGSVSNCNFVDGGDHSYGAIYMKGDNCHISNCNFSNQHSTWEGNVIVLTGAKNSSVTKCNFNNLTRIGAIKFTNSKGFIDNCRFISCYITSVITLNNIIGKISNCEFGDWEWDDAIHILSGSVSVENCIFDATSKKLRSIYSKDASLNIINSSFLNSTEPIKSYNRFTFIDNCTFENCIANSKGGAIFLDGSPSLISDSKFINVRAEYSNSIMDKYGGAIYAKGAVCIVDKCSFIDCLAGSGGAIYFEDYYGEVTNCNFTNCSGNYGGAVYFKSDGNINCSNFVNCSSISYGGAVYVYSTAAINNSNFVNCSSKNGGAIKLRLGGSNVSDSYFENCFAISDGGAVSLTEGNLVKNCTFKNCYISTSTSLDAAIVNSYCEDCIFDNSGLKLITNVNLNLKNEFKDENVKITICLTDENDEFIDGTVNIIMDGNSTQVNLVNGIYELESNNLTLGSHTISVQYLGDESHYASSKNASFYVKTRINLTVEINDTGMLLEGVRILITVTSDSNFTGDVYYDYNKIAMTNGTAYLNKTYEYGSYYLTFNVKNNPCYYSDSAVISFNVYTLPIPAGILITSSSLGDHAFILVDEFWIKIPNAPISYIINNKTYYTVTDDYGNINMLAVNITEPSNVTFKYDGNETYKGFNYTTFILVKPNFNITLGEVIEGSPFTITATSHEDISGIIHISLYNSQFYNDYQTNLDNGFAQINITDLKKGQYTLSFNYNGNEKYYSYYYYADLEVSGKDDDEDDIVLWVNTEDEFSTTSLDALRNIFASVRVPEGTNGNVTFTIDGNVLYNLALSDFYDSRIDHENNIYNIALEVGDEYIFEGLNNADVVKFAFLDDNDKEVVSKEYKLFIGENTIRFKEFNSEGEENSFELWIDNDPQGFDVSSPDLSGYFIGSLTVPENMDGNISIITENDKFLFNKALNDFDPSLIRDNNIYDLSLSDNGRYIFEGVENGTVFKFAFLDDEGSEIWKSSNYKLVMEDNTIWLNELNDDEGDDADDGVVIWVDEGDVKEFDLNNDDDLDSAFAYVSVSNDLDGTIVLYCYNAEEDEEQDFFHIDLADVSNSYSDEERDGFTIYELSFNSLGGQFDILKEVGWFKLAFVTNYGDDESCEVVDCREYNIEYDDEANVIKFWQVGDDADDGVVIWVDEGDVKEFDLNNDDDLDSAFAFVSVSNDLDGTIVLYCFNNEEGEEQDFFHIDLADVSNSYSDEERDGFTIYELSFNSLGGQFDILKEVGWFKLAFVTNYGDDESCEVVDCREYNIEYDDEANVIKFWQTNGGNDEPSEDIELNFEENEDGSMSFEMGDDVTIAYLLIPDTEEFEDTIVNLKIYKNGEVVQTIKSSDIECVLLGSRGVYQYAINIDLTQFEDKDVIGIWADCFNEDDYWEYAVQIDGNNVTFHEYSGPGKEYYIFYGNITIGDLNDASLMGEHPNGRFVSWGISDVFNITEGTIVIRDGETTIAEYSLDDCNVTYSYNILGNVYYLSLDDNNLYDILPENRNVTFTFSYVDESLTFKRIRIGDYVQKVITPDDFLWEEWSNYKFEVAEGSDSDKILTQDDDVIVIYGNSNMQSIYIDFGGGYFSIYVNDTKVENLGYVLHNAWVNSTYYNKEDDYLDDWIPELFLSRLRGGSVSLDEFHIKLADLGITEPGTYNIKIIHTPTFDDDPEHYIYDSETELVNKNITYDPDCTDVLILNESRYKYGMPFLITFQFGENVLSESNRILIYINDELAFNHTILSYEENDYGEMELVNLWKVTPGEFNQELLNEYEFLDTGVYNAVVYLVKGDDAPVEIGSGSFTVVKQKGDMNFTLDSSAEDDGVHAIVYADIPEGDWDDYSLEIVIGDSEKIVPDFEETNDWFSRWYNEYVIFKDNTIYSKESLENIIGKGPVAIDLGVLDEGTHIFVSFGHGEETVHGDWDFYQNDFTVRASIVPADSNLKVTAEDITVDATAVVNIEMDEAFNGEVLVIVDGVVSYTVTVTNGKGSLNISYLSAGVHNVTAKFEGNENYNPVENTTSFTVSKLTPVIVITTGEAVEGSDLDVTVEMASDATGSVDVNGEVIVLVDGKASATIKNLDAGEFNIVVVYSGDAKYVNANETKKVTVKAKEDAGLVVSVDNIAFGEIAVVSIEINANVTGKVTINGNEVAIINGKGSYNLSALDTGVHNVTVVFEGDKYFNACEKTATFTVSKLTPVIVITAGEAVEGSDLDVTVELDSDATGSVKVNGEVIALVDGKASATIKNLEAGEFDIVVVYSGDAKYVNASESKKITVKAKEDADLVVSVDNIAFGDVAVVSIEINANVTGKVTINGNEVAIINGKGSYNLSALDAGVHNVTVVFEGDKYFNACEKTASFNVTAKIVPINPELAIAPVSDIEEGSDVVITISALGNFTGAVSVLVGDSEVGVVNVNDGSATFTIGAGNFTVGLNTVKITSAASENFTAGENSTTFTVTAKVLPKTITKDTLSNYFDENGVYVADLDEIIFVGEFKDIPKITINKAVNITGQNAVFTNTLFNINSDNVAVKDLTINTALTDYAITVTGSNQVSLINNNINAINGILISDSTNFTVESNTIISTAGVNINGIYINGTGSGIVRNNNLNLKSAKTAYAINTNPTGPLKVSYINNTIYAESYFAVGIYDDAEEIRDNKITLSGNYAIGIAVLSENAVVDNNGITLSTTNTGSEVIDEPLGVETAGIKVNNSATITNNDVDSTGKSVSVVGGSSTISDNNLNGQVSLESDGNTISGNVITTTEESAIDASSSTGNTISSNEAYSSTGNGDNAIKAAEGNTVKDNFEKFDPALTVRVADITEGANAVITVKTNNTFSGNVSVKIATDNYTVEVIKGTGSLPISGLAVGTYTATATLKATDVFTESVKNTTFTVKAKVATAISAPAVTTTYATSKNIVVSLKDVSGNVLAGKSVTVVFNGATKTLTTDDKGQVSLAIGTSLVPKTYDATFTFAGDDTYAKSSGSIKVTIKKATPKLTAKKKTFKVKKAKKYTVTLKTDKGKVLNNVKVILKVKGKKYTATVKKGKATFNLKKLTKKGNYKATVTFAGNKYYNKAVVKNVKITVKK